MNTCIYQILFLIILMLDDVNYLIAALLVSSYISYSSVIFILILYQTQVMSSQALLHHPLHPLYGPQYISLPNRKKVVMKQMREPKPPSSMFWCFLMLCCVFCSVFEALGTFLALSSLVSIASSCPLPFPESRLYLPWDLQHIYVYEIIPTGQLLKDVFSHFLCCPGGVCTIVCVSPSGRGSQRAAPCCMHS